MTGEVDVLGQYDYLEVWNHERFVGKLLREPFTRRRRAGAGGVRDLRPAARRPEGRGPWIEPLHEPVLLERSAVVLSSPSAAGCSSTARSASAGTRGRCWSGRDTRDRTGPRPHALPAGGRVRLAAFGDRLEPVHADYRQLGAVLDARGVERVDGVLGGSRRVVDAARRRGSRVQLPARRAARHADGSDRRGRRRPTW